MDIALLKRHFGQFVVDFLTRTEAEFARVPPQRDHLFRLLKNVPVVDLQRIIHHVDEIADVIRVAGILPGFRIQLAAHELLAFLNERHALREEDDRVRLRVCRVQVILAHVLYELVVQRVVIMAGNVVQHQIRIDVLRLDRAL